MALGELEELVIPHTPIEIACVEKYHRRALSCCLVE
jgi:hypothetical protein